MGNPVLSAQGFENNGLKANAMARKRFQQPEPYVRGKYWEIRAREDEVLPDGSIKRRQKRIRLGLVKEMTKKLALRARDAVLGSVNDVSYRPQPASTFEEFAERWLESISSTHKLGSKYAERSLVRRHLIPRWGAMSMKEISISPEAVQRWVSGIAGYAPATIISIANVGSRIFDCAKRWNYITTNPFNGLVLPSNPVVERFAFTQEQMRQIVMKAEEPYRTIFWICSETGARIGEVLALDAASLDLERSVLLIRQNVYHRRIQTTKSGKPREFELSSLLTEHIRPRVKAGYLFPTKRGRTLVPRFVLRDVLRPLCKELGFEIPEGCGFHAFRHGNASVLDRLNVPMRVRQDRLGHARQETTFRYTHACSQDHREVAARLGEIFAPQIVQ